MKNRFALASIAALVGLAACSDSATSPTSSGSRVNVSRPSFAFEDPGFTIQQVNVCKSANSPDNPNDVEGEYSFNITGAVVSTVEIAPGECETVFTNVQPGDQQLVTITEAAAAGVQFDSLVANATIDADGDPQFLGVVYTNTGFTAGANAYHGSRVVFYNTLIPQQGGEGCTPGYWRQDQHLGNWTTYAPGDDFDTTFGVDFFNPDITLIQAVALGGGGVNALARHAVAALLNAASAEVDYEYTVAEVKAIVQNNALSFEARKNLLATENERGCDLARAEGN